jgi:hypothetical protein
VMTCAHASVNQLEWAVCWSLFVGSVSAACVLGCVNWAGFLAVQLPPGSTTASGDEGQDCMMVDVPQGVLQRLWCAWE